MHAAAASPGRFSCVKHGGRRTHSCLLRSRSPYPLNEQPPCSGKALLDDFADEVADIVGGGEGASAIDAVFQRHKANQKFGADLEAQVGSFPFLSITWPGQHMDWAAHSLGCTCLVPSA